MVQYNSMEQTNKRFVSIALLALVILFGAGVGYVIFKNYSSIPTNVITTTEQTPVLSVDNKSTTVDGEVILAVDHDTIFNWFKTSSQLCDDANITSTPDRKSFCENKDEFKNQTRFASLIVSPDNKNIGFTIETDTLFPDKVVGIFSRTDKVVTLLSNFYLGNEFIGFSPSGANFAYYSDCLGGMCALYIKNSETLVEKITLSDAEYADARTNIVMFVRWISDNEIEYQQGTEVKRASF